MKKLILLILILPGIALSYFEINDDVPAVFSPAGEQQWRMWSGHDQANILFDDSSGILFDDVNESLIVGKFTPGEAPPDSVSVGYFASKGTPVPQAASYTNIGAYSGYFNTASLQSSLGHFAGYFNTGISHVAIGRNAGRNNDGDRNTAIGTAAFNRFELNGIAAKEIASLDVANNRVTITAGGGHGFGDVGDYLNLKITTTGILPAGLVTAFDVWKINTSEILELFSGSFTDAGTGMHTLTPQITYTNSTALGFNAEPDDDDQIMLGDTNIGEVKTTGAINAGGGLTLGGNIIIPDGGFIGSVSDTDAIQIEADGDVVMTQDLAVSGALTANSITTTEFTVQADGDTFWTGSGTGLPYGHMYVDGTQVIRVALTVSTVAEVKGDGTGGTAAAEDGWLTGDLNQMTFPTGGTEHYITITKRGVYHINWNLSFKMVSGAANTQMHGGLAVDGTAIRNKCEAHRTISNNTDTGNMAGSCIVDLPNGNEELSVWLLNSTNSNDADVSHGSLVSVMVGGTTVPTDVLLLETGDGLLLETGDGILLES